MSTRLQNHNVGAASAPRSAAANVATALAVDAAKVATKVPAVCAIVLAAGFSTRMGRPKALLDWHGTPFLAQICRMLADAGIARIAAVLSAANAAACRLHTPATVVCAINPRPEDGMLSSLRCGLRALDMPDAHIMLCLVDHPGVQIVTYRALMAQAATDKIIVPLYHGRRGHPTLFGASFVEELRSGACPDGARSVVHAHPHALCEIAVDDPFVVTDIDTPADYAAAVGSADAPRRR
jgi:CTP:molybdopterin cytidylyltransferase MocA